MISDLYNCIFVHIPKAAGQSIERFFLDLHGLSWRERAPLLLRYNRDPNRGPERLAHLTAREYVDCGYVSPEAFDAAFKFAFVRNPWDRIVSEYHYFGYDKRYDFKDFVTNGLPPKSGYTDAYRHAMPQVAFLYDDTGTLMVDFVGRFESLQKDFDQVCARLGIAETTLPHSNASKRTGNVRNGRSGGQAAERQSKRPYTDYYDDALVEQVGRIYAKDIEAFGYQFGA